MGAGKRAREEMEREGGKRWRKEGAVMNQTRFASFYTVIASIFFRVSDCGSFDSLSEAFVWSKWSVEASQVLTNLQNLFIRLYCLFLDTGCLLFIPVRHDLFAFLCVCINVWTSCVCTCSGPPVSVNNHVKGFQTA